MKTDVQYLLFDQAVSWKDLSNYMVYVSQERQRRLAQFVFEKDRLASLLAELLIRSEIMTALGLHNDAIRFSYNSYGKPFLDGFADYQFSVSHTDGCVAFAGGSQSVGIDVEKIAKYDPQIPGHFFAPQEAQWIEEQADRSMAFYDIWTKKEAYLKMLGTGLSKPLQSFNVFSHGLNAKWITKKLSNHIMTLCCEDKNTETGILAFHERKISSLLQIFDRL